MSEASVPAADGADTLRRFMLSGAPVRGEVVSLDTSWREVAGRHAFPRSVRDRLGELCAAGLLLSASLKFDGSLILQIHGDGPVSLLVVECDAGGAFRATAKLREGTDCPEDADLATLVNAHGRGRFVVTLDPRTDSPNRQPYQGIVPFEGRTVAEVLERYMARSEQVPTRLWLAADDARATGLLLQRLPEDGGHAARPSGTTWTPGIADEGTGPARPVGRAAPDAAEPAAAPHAQGSAAHDGIDPAADLDGWNRMQHLADTITRDELLALPSDSVLRRLFWQESLTAFDARTPRFACSCSRAKVASMLRMLGQAEIESIVAEQGSVGVRCEFCNTPYDFDAIEGVELFLSEPTAPGSTARH
ncbi:MAG: Hsp33 family molecular chaperone HslO [Burkholderiales bacterium]|nr:MAG: Hsp33 family molecular chaperone HslO [Burkholderiales bacterium]